MPLCNYSVAPLAEVDDAITIKADDGKERAVTEIPREFLDDYFRQRSLTNEQRRKLVESNLEALAATITQKYDQGMWEAESRFGSTIRRVVITMSDLRAGPRLTDICLVVEERAGFQRSFR
jgi:hypothetical protein